MNILKFVDRGDNMFKNLYEYRELLKSNVKKEIRGKYKGSFLGVLWSFINPLLQTIVYTIVFSIIMRSTMENYIIYVITGIIPWTFFTNVITQGTNTILINGGIIKKVYFPREIMPISITTSGLVNLFISCIIILLFCIFSGVGISFCILLLPVIAIIQYVLTLGCIFILSAVDVYIRDIEYIVSFILNLAFYGTPILYETSMFAKWEWILNLNPLTHILNAYRAIFYYKTLPDFSMLGIIGIFSLVVCFVGYKIFKKLERGFAEEL